jgi:hypothetical protein
MKKLIAERRVVATAKTKNALQQLKSNPTPILTFTAKDLADLKRAYAHAASRGADRFTYRGHVLLTDYAKYLIQYLEYKNLT